MRNRGSVLIESALTLGLILSLLYGTLQLGMVGLEQMTADGGAYLAAHQDAFQGDAPRTYTAGTTIAQNALQHLQSADSALTIHKGEPPTTAFNGQYNLANPNARYGGVSMIQPVQLFAIANRKNIDSIVMGLTSPITVTGISIEPMYRLINPHGDVAGANFNSIAAFNTNVDPLTDTAPPYFVGFNYIPTCAYSPTVKNGKATWTCLSTSVISALGTAEFLDAQNWSRPNSGVTPDLRAIFWETRYHQALFASIAQTLAVTPAANKDQVLDPLALNPALASDVACVYSFDNTFVGSYNPGNFTVGNPLFALHPDGDASPRCPAP